MARSKFLKFQDKNNDNLIDACETEQVEPLVDNCPACKPNLAAIVPDWRTKTIDSPFYNEREGAYQVTVVTTYKDTGGAGQTEEEATATLKGRFYVYVYEAITALLTHYEKSDTDEFKELCKAYIEYADYELAPYANSRLKLLYSIPCELFYNIPSKEEEETYEEEQADSEEEGGGDESGEIVIDAATFIEYSTTVRKGLELYNRYLKVFRALEKGNFVFEEGPRKGAIFDLSSYGDNGFSRDSLMFYAQQALITFLKDNKILVPGSRLFASWHDPAVEIKITLKTNENGTRQIETIAVTTELCGTEEKIFKGAKIRALLENSPSLKDQVVLGYLQNLSKMNTDLTARTPKPWKEFIEEHTLPTVTSTINHVLEQQLAGDSTLGCIGEYFDSNINQLGQNLLDEVFSIGDAIAYRFRFEACTTDETKFLEKQQKLGLVLTPLEEIPNESDVEFIPAGNVDLYAQLLAEGHSADAVSLVESTLNAMAESLEPRSTSTSRSTGVSAIDDNYRDFARHQYQSAHSRYIEARDSFEVEYSEWEESMRIYNTTVQDFGAEPPEEPSFPSRDQLLNGIPEVEPRWTWPIESSLEPQYAWTGNVPVIGFDVSLQGTYNDWDAPGWDQRADLDAVWGPLTGNEIAPSLYEVMNSPEDIARFLETPYHAEIVDTAIEKTIALIQLQESSRRSNRRNEIWYGQSTPLSVSLETGASVSRVRAHAGRDAFIAYLRLISTGDYYLHHNSANLWDSPQGGGFDSLLSHESVLTYAREQAFGEVANSNQALAGFCGALNWGDGVNGQELLDDLLSSIKLCGFNELMLETIGCLMGGLPFDVAVSKIVEAALKGMNIRTFYDLFLGLPPDKRQQLDELVKKKIAEGDIIGEGGGYNPNDYNNPTDNMLDRSTTNEATDTLDTLAVTSTQTVERTEAYAGTMTSRSVNGVTYSTEEEYQTALADARIEASENQVKSSLDVVDVGSDATAFAGGSFGASTTARHITTAFTGTRTTIGQESNTTQLDPRAILDSMGRSASSGGSGGSAGSAGANRPLFEQLDVGSEANRSQLSETVVVQLYIKGLLEVYQGNLLEALDLLNKFPGGPLIAQFLAGLNCPVPPTGITNAYDFIKDFEFHGNPFCNANWDMTVPEFMFQNPFDFAAQLNLKDLFGLLKPAIIAAINDMIVKLIVALLQKVCEMIGSISCQTLKTTGAMVAGAVASGGKEALTNIIKNSICGSNASQATVDETLIEMVANLGLGAAAFANKQRTLDYMNDIASATTPVELSNAVLGNASDEFKRVALEIRKLEYPEFESALPHKQAIGQLFDNCGNLMPLGFRQQLKDYLNSLDPALNGAAGNPSLCASPEDLQNFENLRCDLLAGRATPGQCEQMSPQRRRAQELGDLASVYQNPDSLFDQPLIADPGCENGIIPFQPEAVIAAATTGLGYELDLIRMAFADDMIGNGPWESDYGMLNMILSDTQGNPLSAHNRKVSRQEFGPETYVDYYVENATATDGQKYATTAIQIGAYPVKVASWLQTQLGASGSQFNSNNEYQNPEIIGSYDYKKQKSSIIGLGDSEKYNITYKIRPDHDDVLLILEARKKTSDLSMDFYDNNNGYGTLASGTRWKYGHRIEAFISDVIKVENVLSSSFNLEQDRTPEIDSSIEDKLLTDNATPHLELPNILTEQKVINLPTDNMRVKISTLTNIAEHGFSPLFMDQLEITAAEALLPGPQEGTPIIDLEYEFMSIDGYMSGSQFTAPWVDTDMSAYPKFLSTFEHRQQYMPPVVLLGEIINQHDSEYQIDKTKSFHDYFMSSFMNNVMTSVSGNAEAFTYGALLDELTPADTEYVVAANQTNSAPGTSYYEATITVVDESGDEITRNLTSDDKILGISRMQYQMEAAGTPELNRVFYLDPDTFGGKYLNPPLYIKPLINKNWFGMVDIMFPGESACKPAKTDVVTFDDINEKMDMTYQNIPEDPKLASDPACFIEMPYQRVLERYSVAAIEGIITATIRSYVTSHFIKSLATLTYFKPDFVNNYSSAYIQYIVEDLERDLRDSQRDFFEAFNPFKDEEFWYSFLEQGIQLYSRRVGPDGDITNPPEHVVLTLTRLNDKIESYMENALTRTEWSRENRMSAVLDSGLMKLATLGMSNFAESYEEYSARKVYEFVQSTEEDAKIIFGELVKEQVEYIGDKFLENIKTLGWEPVVNNLDYYFLQTYTQGGIDLDLDKEIKEEYLSIDEGDNQYTTGGLFTTPDGTEYVGYYHTSTNDQGNLIFMSGGEHIIGDHDQLTPIDSKVIVPIGDVSDYGTPFGFDSSRPFLIEKYVKIDGTKYSSATGKEMVQAKPEATNISDHYPGTMELVYNDRGIAIGLTGELGVRCGIQMSMYISEKSMAFNEFIQDFASDSGNLPISITNSINTLLTTAGSPNIYELIATNPGVMATLESYFENYSDEEYADDLRFVFLEAEVDALDTTVEQFLGVEGDSKLLLCLINKLVDDPQFKILNRYIFPFNKIVSLTAIYNDLALLPSVGQVGVSLLDTYSTTIADKPGQYVTVSGETLKLNAGAIGWSHPLQRKDKWFVTEYDNWDQIVMRNVKGRAKKLFKGHYLGRQFDPVEDAKENNPGPGAEFFKNLRHTLKPSAGERLLPRWKSKNLLKGNPFDSTGQICSKDDSY